MRRLCDLYGEIENAGKAIGVKQTIKAVQKGLCKCVYIARDADRTIIKDLEELCGGMGVPLKYADSMKQLGKACGIEVGASAAGILKIKDSKDTGEGGE
jgi:large subunit ribosomal protein L7A